MLTEYKKVNCPSHIHAKYCTYLSSHNQPTMQSCFPYYPKVVISLLYFAMPNQKRNLNQKSFTLFTIAPPFPSLATLIQPGQMIQRPHPTQRIKPARIHLTHPPSPPRPSPLEHEHATITRTSSTGPGTIHGRVPGLKVLLPVNPILKIPILPIDGHIY